MDANELSLKEQTVWAKVLVIIVVSVIWSIAAFQIVDRVGPLRPIVTSSYQAK